jgi:N-sulfoglucosamine sulfohydrolase
LTIVVVTADNGMPFPNIKGQVYEYSNHLPLAIMWPKGIKSPGRVVDDFVNFIDFAPTFLELAGIDNKKAGMQPVTGISLTDILYSNKSGTINPKRNFELVGKERHDVGRPNDEGYPVRGLVKNSFLYLHNFKPDRWPVGNPEAGYPNVDGSPTKTYLLNTRRVTGDLQYWQPAFGKRPELELYNIKDDPYCIKNLAGDAKYTAIIKKMDNEMTGKLKQQQDPRMFGQGDVFDHYPYAGQVKDFYNRLMKGEKVKANWINESDKDDDLMKK